MEAEPQVEQQQEEQQLQHHLFPILLLDRSVGEQYTNVLHESLCLRPVKIFARSNYMGTVVPSSCEPTARVAQVHEGLCIVCCSMDTCNNGKRHVVVGCCCHHQKSCNNDLRRHSSSS